MTVNLKSVEDIEREVFPDNKSNAASKRENKGCSQALGENAGEPNQYI